MRLPSQELEPTSRVVTNLCVASTFDDKLGTDSVYLAQREAKGGLRALIKFDVSRRDRNVADVISVQSDRIVALVNGGVDLFEPFFVKRVRGQFMAIRKPQAFEGCPGGGQVAIIDGYQICYVNCEPEVSGKRESVVFIFSEGGLKYAKVPFYVGSLRSDGLRFIEFQEWLELEDGRVSRRWVRFGWPLMAKDGYWMGKRVSHQ
ncbi:MAG: hypothetical protein AMXMBFR19_22160 [Chthonomonadaceae bacterium]|uniref:Uncharacterized protein n=1 Tax=Candidatus Nitrosymbiomonas proteolyticus TaxID=2608984 RepID=A0A809SCP3_9BACT|nr:conserved hypothetical protein [Candidatus Nitrosymbiomonas proteolyticus]